MPLPLLIAAGTALVGASLHGNAKAKNEAAEQIVEAAREKYDDEKKRLETCQKSTENALLSLGAEKKKTLNGNMSRFIQSYQKIKNVSLKESEGSQEIYLFTMGQKEVAEMMELTDSYASFEKQGGAGALVGLAAVGSMGFLGGAAVTSFSGAAAVAGTLGFGAPALAMGSVLAPLGAIATPVYAITGISASLKAGENLEKAYVVDAQVDETIEKMKISETLCEGITEKSEMFRELLCELNEVFYLCSIMMEATINSKERRQGQVSLDDFDEEDYRLFAVTRAVAGAVKAVIDTPILNKSGNLTRGLVAKRNEQQKLLPVYTQEINEIKQIKREKYRAEGMSNRQLELMLAEKEGKEQKEQVVTLSDKDGTRNTVASIFGAVLSILLTWKLTENLYSSYDKFLFISADLVDKIAVGIILWALFVTIFGKTNGTKLGKRRDDFMAISLSILFVEYCNTVELMDHCILTAILTFVAILVVVGIVKNLKIGQPIKVFVAKTMGSLFAYPVLFFLYWLFCIQMGLWSGLIMTILCALVWVYSYAIMSD